MVSESKQTHLKPYHMPATNPMAKRISVAICMIPMKKKSMKYTELSVLKEAKHKSIIGTTTHEKETLTL